MRIITKLISEHAARKCKIPKKMKLFLFNKKVAVEITAEINTNLKKRFKNFFLKLSDRLRILDDIPAIVIKLKPIN